MKRLQFILQEVPENIFKNDEIVIAEILPDIGHMIGMENRVPESRFRGGEDKRSYWLHDKTGRSVLLKRDYDKGFVYIKITSPNGLHQSEIALYLKDRLGTRTIGYLC